MLSFLLILGYDVVTQSDYFKTERIDVKGNRQLTKLEVIDQAGIDKATNIFSANLSIVRRRLLAHPMIADARIRREFPSRIQLDIREHQPLAILDLGRKFIINRKGEIFREMAPFASNHLPVINGLEYKDINLPGQPESIPFNAVMEVLRLGQCEKSILPNHMLKRIHVDREIGLTLYATDKVKTIKLGYNDYQNKYERLEKVLFHLKMKPEFTDINSVDLNNLDRIVVNPSREMPPDDSQKEV